MTFSNQIARDSGREASHSEPCPICDSNKWCFIFNDGNGAICGYSQDAPQGWHYAGESKDGRSKFLKGHKKGRSLPRSSEVRLRLYPRHDSPEWKRINDYGIPEREIIYFYPDPKTGEPLGAVRRRQFDDRRPAYQGKTKEIRPLHWQSGEDVGVQYAEDYQGDRGWWSDRGKGSKPFPLYRQDEIAKAINAGLDLPVFYVAGEQAVEAARNLGLFALTNQGGEGSYHDQIIQFLRDNTPPLFIIWGDSDTPGRENAAQLLSRCDKARIPTVVIEPLNIWSKLPDKGDIVDILQKSGMTQDEIFQRLEAEIKRAVEARHKEKDPGNRLKLDLQAYLREVDPFKQIPERSRICAEYRISSKDFETLIHQIKYAESQPFQKPRMLSLKEVFALESQALKWIVPGYIPSSTSGLLSGLPGSGKTQLLLDLAYAVATGGEFLGEKVQQGRVLFICSDQPLNITASYLADKGFSEDMENIMVVGQTNTMSAWTIKEMEALEGYLEEFRPALTIIDSIRTTIAYPLGIEEKSEQIGHWLKEVERQVVRFNSSLMWIHHDNKAKDLVGVEKASGSTAIVGNVSFHFRLQKSSNDQADTRRLLTMPKTRGFEPVSALLEFNPESSCFEFVGIEGDADGAKATLQQQIMQLLQKQPGSWLEGLEIKEALGGNPGIYSVLSRMAARGIISRRKSKTTRGKVYSLPLNEPENAPTGTIDPPASNASDITSNNGGHSPPLLSPGDSCLMSEMVTEQGFQTSNTTSNTHQTTSNNSMFDEPHQTASNPDTASNTETSNTQHQTGGGEGVQHTLFDVQSQNPECPQLAQSEDPQIAEAAAASNICDSAIRPDAAPPEQDSDEPAQVGAVFNVGDEVQIISGNRIGKRGFIREIDETDPIKTYQIRESNFRWLDWFSASALSHIVISDRKV